MHFLKTVKNVYISKIVSYLAVFMRDNWPSDWYFTPPVRRLRDREVGPGRGMEHHRAVMSSGLVLSLRDLHGGVFHDLA